jgi:hypothetical protein
MRHGGVAPGSRVTEQTPMGIREKLKEKPAVTASIAAVFLAIAVGILIWSYWPEKKADLSKAYYSDDDGKTWFAESAFLVAPFQHNGKTAVVAQVYSYDDGKKQFCAYLAQFTPDAKKRLDAALADAQKAGRPPGSVDLYHDPNFMKHGTQVKLPGANQPWISYDDPKAQEIFAIHSPDGSAVDQSFVY